MSDGGVGTGKSGWREAKLGAGGIGGGWEVAEGILNTPA